MEMENHLHPLNLGHEGPQRVRPLPHPSSSNPLGSPVGDMDDSAAARILRQESEMLDARFAAIDDRLAPKQSFRPSLVKDRGGKIAAIPPASPVRGGRGNTRTTSTPSNKGKGNKKSPPIPAPKKGWDGQMAPPPRAAKPLPPEPNSMDEEWTLVVKKGGREKAAERKGPTQDSSTPAARSPTITASKGVRGSPIQPNAQGR